MPVIIYLELKDPKKKQSRLNENDRHIATKMKNAKENSLSVIVHNILTTNSSHSFFTWFLSSPHDLMTRTQRQELKRTIYSPLGQQEHEETRRLLIRGMEAATGQLPEDPITFPGRQRDLYLEDPRLIKPRLLIQAHPHQTPRVWV